MNKKIIYILLLLCSINIVYATDFKYNINYTSLPFYKTEDILLSAIENISINITYDSFIKGVNFYNFSNSKNVTLSLDLNVSNVNVGNYSSYVIINASNETYSTILNFTFYIINDTNFIYDTQYIQLSINEFKYKMCDYKLPINDSRLVSIVGKPNQEVFTKYNASIFSMPDVFYLDSAGLSIIEINISFDNVTEGNFTEVIEFSIISNFSNITYYFEIIDCIQPPPNADDILKECRADNLTVEQYMRCIQAQVEYWRSYYDSLAELQEKRTVNNTIYENVTEEKLIRVLDIEEQNDIISALRDFSLTWKQLRTDTNANNIKITEQANKITELENKNIDLENNLNAKVDEKLRYLIDTNDIKDNTIDMYEESYVKKSFIWFWICSLIFLGALGYSLYYYQETRFY